MAPIPHSGSIDFNELGGGLKMWLSTDKTLRLQLMKWVLMGNMKAPDTIGNSILEIETYLGKELFPPIVEHALWEAAPFLTRTRYENSTISYIPAGGMNANYLMAIQEALSIYEEENK